MAEAHVRAAQLADQIRDYLAAWTARVQPGSFVSVTGVTLTPNLKVATVWVRVIGNEQAALQALEKQRRSYQHRLVTTLPRFKVPAISFALDVRPDLPPPSEGLPKE